jgi:hypothetical protein
MKYKLIDLIPEKDIVRHTYNKGDKFLCYHVSEEKLLTVGDMLAFRDMILEYGYILWKDFKIVKLED